MADLRALYEAEGHTSVTTYIQSGNVLFVSAAKRGDALSATMSAAIERHFGFPVVVTHRTATELAAVAKANPYASIDADEKQLGVALLGGKPTAAAWKSLDPNRSAPDEFVRGDRAVYLHVPNSFARTKLTNAYIEKQLGVSATTRNWRTMNKLVELSQSEPYV